MTMNKNEAHAVLSGAGIMSVEAFNPTNSFGGVNLHIPASVQPVEFFETLAEAVNVVYGAELKGSSTAVSNVWNFFVPVTYFEEK